MKECRSLLFVPAEGRRLSKIGQTEADAYIIDLEDSVAAENKDAALRRTVGFLSSCGTGRLFVRVNRQRYRAELEALRDFSVGFMLPKIETERDYAEAGEILRQHEVIALVETPRALLNADAVAGIPWVSALAFGAEDFTAAANMLNSTDTLGFPKQLLVLAAKANHKKVYDTPCFSVHSDETLRAELQQAVSLGFDGKLAIHPRQAEVINSFFSVRDPGYIRHVIDVYESSGNAVCEIDGRVYEKLHIDRLRKMLVDVDGPAGL